MNIIINKTMRKYVPSEQKTKKIVTTILILVLILSIVISFLFALVMRTGKLYSTQQNYLEITDEINDITVNLTSCVLTTTYSGEKACTNFASSVERREYLIDELHLLGLTDEESELLLAFDKSVEDVVEMEFDAKSKIDADDLEGARDIIFSDEYRLSISIMNENLDKLGSLISTRMVDQVNLARRATWFSFINTLLISFAIAVFTLLLLYNYRQLKKQSNIDPLTGLKNRNEYAEDIKKIIKNNPDKYGALIYCDIDNLKFINECYGHKNGDKYIQATANSLRKFEKYDSVLARIAGDEFIIFVHGFETREDTVNIVHKTISESLNTFFSTSLNAQEKVRFTSGASVYPSDSSSLDDLQKYADYAMLKTKKSSKGEISFYDKGTFDKSTFMLANKGHLDQFLEKGKLDFAFQPIVHADTFEVYGYETLMRPQFGVINSPFILLQLAKEESKLDKIERLVAKNVVIKISENQKALKNCKVFINSIADRMLTKEELDHYVTEYPCLLENIVVEVTEQEYVDPKLLKTKTSTLKEFGALIALDDYGAGYSNEFTLLSGLYDIIKIDMKIIRDIDKDPKRQEIIKSIVNISKINDFKVLAEGVEYANEAKALRKLGVNYMQGYFFGKPSLEVKKVNKQALDKLDSNHKWID